MDYQELAQQLRKPEGELGRQIGQQLNTSNRSLNLISIDILDLSSGDKVLEIGMGNGYFCQYVLEQAPYVSYTGLDFSDTMVEEASKLNISSDEDKVAFVLGDASQLPFSTNSFDKVFTVNTIYFWEDPDKVCAEIFRVLKPGGKFLIGLRSPEMMKNLPFVEYGFDVYDKKRLFDLLLKNDFKSVDIQLHVEPDQEYDGNLIKVESIIAIGFKP